METFKYVLQLVGDYWWLWGLLALASFWWGLQQMKHTPQDVLRARGYLVSAVVPLYLFCGLFVLALSVLALRLGLPWWAL